MTPVTLTAKTFFHNIWELFLSVDVPGLEVSFAALLISLFLIRFSLRMLGYLTGFGMSGGDYGRAATIAEKHKNDRQKGLESTPSKIKW